MTNTTNKLLKISLSLVILLAFTSFEIFAQDSIDVDQENYSYDKNAYHLLYSSDGKLLHVISKVSSLQSSNESIKQLSEKSITLDSITDNPLADITITNTYDSSQYDKIDTRFGLELQELDIYLKQRFTTDTINDLFYKVGIVVDRQEELDNLPKYLTVLTDKKTNDILSNSSIFPKKTLNVLVNLNQFSELDEENEIIKIDPITYLETMGLSKSESTQLSVNIKLLKPLQQMNNGLLPHQISCDDKFELLIQNSLTKSICVMPDSVETLQKRGWY